MVHCYPNSAKMESFIHYLVSLEKERDKYKEIAEAYRALKGKTIETCPDSCKRDFQRRQEIIEDWERR